jgi:hypothetical protein
MSIHEPTTSLSTDGTVAVIEETESDEAIKSGFMAGLGDVATAEHPAVLGGRIGACLFSSFAFPSGLWALGAVDTTSAALIAAVATLVVTRPILLLGGTRISRVLALEMLIAALAFSSTFSLIPSLILAVFFPLLGMLACVSLAAQVATTWFVADERPYEADVVIARATQANVVDIRAAGIARRSGAKPQPRAASEATGPTPQSQQQAR